MSKDAVKRRLHLHTFTIMMSVLAIFVGGGVYIVAEQAGKAGGEAAVEVVEEYSIQSDTQQCDRGNVIRADRHLDAEDGTTEEWERVKAIYQILDCAKTVVANNRGDRSVPLAPPVQREYIELIRKKRLPIVDGGQVIGSTAFPRPPRQ